MGAVVKMRIHGMTVGKLAAGLLVLVLFYLLQLLVLLLSFYMVTLQVTLRLNVSPVVNRGPG